MISYELYSAVHVRKSSAFPNCTAFAELKSILAILPLQLYNNAVSSLFKLRTLPTPIRNSGIRPTCQHYSAVHVRKSSAFLNCTAFAELKSSLAILPVNSQISRLGFFTAHYITLYSPYKRKIVLPRRKCLLW